MGGERRRAERRTGALNFNPSGCRVEDMEKSNKAMLQVLEKILINVSAISVGAAFFEKEGWAFSVAVVAALGALCLAWRSEHE